MKRHVSHSGSRDAISYANAFQLLSNPEPETGEEFEAHRDRVRVGLKDWQTFYPLTIESEQRPYWLQPFDAYLRAF